MYVDEDRRVESDDAAGQSSRSVGLQIDGFKRSIGPVALGRHRFSAAATTVRVEVVFLLAVLCL